MNKPILTNFDLPPDPLKVLETTRFVVENSDNVYIDVNALEIISQKVKHKIQQGLGEAVSSHKDKIKLEKALYLIFIEDVVNFCFWAEKDKPKWEVKWPSGNLVKGGAFGLRACFQRVVDEQPNLLDSKYLSTVSFEEVAKLFRSSNGVDIPLIEKRWENLKEAGRVLTQQYNGNFLNLLEQSDYDAIKLVKIIYENFPSFRDIGYYRSKEVIFLKRAQICAYDLSLSVESNRLKNIDRLTAFADYKLPQILRKFGVINYSNELANQIDSYLLLPSGSEKEIEIRANTIWAVELIRQQLKIYPAVQIDNALWLLSQDQSDIKPYHRTYTIYY